MHCPFEINGSINLPTKPSLKRALNFWGRGFLYVFDRAIFPFSFCFDKKTLKRFVTHRFGLKYEKLKGFTQNPSFHLFMVLKGFLFFHG
ncbi:MAG: hypothetical protein CM15mV129_310 [uncultured marine virus]|nr:MAG: hypothetical protein CM15mV129_310 [uncultured marine virus]